MAACNVDGKSRVRVFQIDAEPESKFQTAVERFPAWLELAVSLNDSREDFERADRWEYVALIIRDQLALPRQGKQSQERIQRVQVPSFSVCSRPRS
jgi:hypothetical protein